MLFNLPDLTYGFLLGYGFWLNLSIEINNPTDRLFLTPLKFRYFGYKKPPQTNPLSASRFQDHFYQEMIRELYGEDSAQNFAASYLHKQGHPMLYVPPQGRASGHFFNNQPPSIPHPRNQAPAGPSLPVAPKKINNQKKNAQEVKNASKNKVPMGEKSKEVQEKKKEDKDNEKKENNAEEAKNEEEPDEEEAEEKLGSIDGKEKTKQIKVKPKNQQN